MKKAIFFLLCIVVFITKGNAQSSLPSLALNKLSLPSLALPPTSSIRIHQRSNAINRVDDNCNITCPIILPLTALELQGVRLNDYQVTLNWKTKNEINSRGFDLERSLGDQTSFKVVGALPSSTSTATEKKYALMDANSFSGLSYYRIKQIDIDGHFAYSNTIQVKGYNPKEAVWLSPNPASTVAVLYCYTATKGNYFIKVLSANGQTVYTQKWALNLGSNSTKLPVQTFSPGMYYVQLIWPDGHHNDLKMAVE